MLTILGYGINDTIVIFDRIRENTGGAAKKNITALASLVNTGIHQTLGRSIMTSLTTVIVMIPLLIICGSTIRSFILPLLVGVIASTLSSIFIATSLWYDINRITEKRSYNGKSSKPAKRRSQKSRRFRSLSRGYRKRKADFYQNGKEVDFLGIRREA